MLMNFPGNYPRVRLLSLLFCCFFGAVLAAQVQVPAPNLQCVTAQADRVDLTWTNESSSCGVRDATQIFRATEPDGPYVQIAELLDSTATTFSDPNPLGELRYYYLRYAFNCNDVTPPSSDTLDSFIPRTPVIRYVSLEDDQLIIDWEPSSSPEVIGYVVLEVLPTSFLPLDTIRNATQFTVIANGSPAVDRRFRIVAFDACGNLSPQSAILAAANLSGSGGAGCDSRIVLTVDQPSLQLFQPLARLELFVSTDGGPFVAAPPSAPATANEIRYDEANDDTEVCFYLEGVLLGDESRARSAVYCQTVTITQPVRPFNLFGVSVNTDGSLAFRFQNDQVQPVPVTAELLINRQGNIRESADLPLDLFTMGDQLTFPPLANPLQAGETASFRLTDACMREVETNAVAPVRLTASSFFPGNNQLNWTPLVNNLGGGLSYNVFRIDTAGAGLLLAGNLTGLNFTDETASAGTESCYRVEAVYRADTTGIITTYFFWSNVVCVSPQTEVYVPNAFNPNSTEAANRVFQPLFSSPPAANGYDFRVYDRWGGLRFFTDDPTSGWDGTSDGQELRSGTYLYVIEYETSRGTPRRSAGTVNLLR